MREIPTTPEEPGLEREGPMIVSFANPEAPVAPAQEEEGTRNENPADEPEQPPQPPTHEETCCYSRKKGVAIALAIFFGPFTWLYTYRVDHPKFWISVLAALTFVGWYIAYIYAIIEAIKRPQEFYGKYPHFKRS